MIHYFRTQSKSIKNDLLSGITVALALVPEAIAFAFVAGVSPIIGLYSAFFIGVLTAIFGGRPGMISGATGAMAVVVVGLVAMHGVEYLFPTVILCGLLQVGIGLARLGKLIRMVPHPVMLGFVNGLAIVIGMAQLSSFKTLTPSGSLDFMSGQALLVMLLLVLLTMGIIWLLPKFTKAVPSSLVAILSVTLIAVGINSNPELFGKASRLANVGDMVRMNEAAKEIESLRGNASIHASSQHLEPAAHLISFFSEEEQRNSVSNSGPQHSTFPVSTPFSANALGDENAGINGDITDSTKIAAILDQVQSDSVEGKSAISGDLPNLFFLDSRYVLPPANLSTLLIIFPFAIVLCGVGLIESLMTLSLIDEITETRGRGNRECIGQGIANITCGLFGGMGGCAMIGQSLINVNSGGRGRLSGITAATCLLLFILFLGPWIQQIPMAALVGVMFMVVIGTFEWASLKMFRRMPRSDVLVMVFVTLYTVFMHDLASAVILGVIISALVFAWKHATHMGADIKYNEFGSKIYQVHGPLFFASVSSFKDLFDISNDPHDVVIDFYYSRVYDQSGLEAINSLADKYESSGKRLHLTHLSPECRILLDRAGDFVEINLSEDPQYHVATDRLVEDSGQTGTAA